MGSRIDGGKGKEGVGGSYFFLRSQFLFELVYFFEES